MDLVDCSKILDIATDSDPILKIVAKPVDIGDISSSHIQNLISSMLATMYAASGIGLAAPQIRISLRIIVYYLPPTRDDVNGSGIDETILINPEIFHLDDSKVGDYEGCLSVIGKRGRVPRYYRIRYSGLNRYGQFIEGVAEGWHARLIQHEVDHLNGILYPELMEGEDELLSLEAFQLLQKQNLLIK